MSLAQWQNNGWLRRHATSREEIGNLLGIARRDMSDARSRNISDDWRFGIAYNAALKLCTALLYAEGYRPAHTQAHYRALQSLPLILGAERAADATYLEACRVKRNTVEYDYVGGATSADAEELIDFTGSLERDALQWLAQRHPELV
jgi:uncharacterized protein (UPF0332 family)